MTNDYLDIGHFTSSSQCQAALVSPVLSCCLMLIFGHSFFSSGKGGKNRRRGKNENEDMKRELVFKDDGQG